MRGGRVWAGATAEFDLAKQHAAAAAAAAAQYTMQQHLEAPVSFKAGLSRVGY
jgi:hypothetical protein